MRRQRLAAVAVWAVAVAAVVVALAAPALADPTPTTSTAHGDATAVLADGTGDVSAGAGVVGDPAGIAGQGDAAREYLPPLRWSTTESSFYPAHEAEGLTAMLREGMMQWSSMLLNLIWGITFGFAHLVWAGAVLVISLLGGILDLLLKDRAGELNEALRNIAIGADGGGGIVGSGVLWLFGAVVLLFAAFTVIRGNIGGTVRAVFTFFLFSGLAIAAGLTAMGDGEELPRGSPVWWAQQVETVVHDVSTQAVAVVAEAPLTLTGDYARSTVAGQRDLPDVEDINAPDALSCSAYANQLVREYRSAARDPSGLAIATTGLFQAYHLDAMRLRLRTGDMTCHMLEHGSNRSPQEIAELTYLGARSAGASSSLPTPSPCAFGYAPDGCPDAGHDDHEERDAAAALLLATDACLIRGSDGSGGATSGGATVEGDPLWVAALEDGENLHDECAEWWASGTPPPTLMWDDQYDLRDSRSDEARESPRVFDHILTAWQAASGRVHSAMGSTLTSGLVLVIVAFTAAFPLFLVSLWVLAKSIEFSLWVIMLPASLALTAIPRLRNGDVEVGSAASRWAWKRTFDSALATFLGNVIAALYVHIFVFVYSVLVDLFIF